MSETFKFGNVHGPVNAGSGNMNVGSGQQSVAGRDLVGGSRFGDDPNASAALARIRKQLDTLRLTMEERASAERELHGVQDAHDAESATGHLEAFVQLAKRAGALAAGGSSIVESILALSRAIGPAAAKVIDIL